MLAGLASRSEHVHLEGLNEPDVTALVASVAGEAQAKRWAAEIHRRTGGHPFFVREMASLLDTASDAAGVPSVVRDAIEQRLARLPGRARAVMDAAAVAGNELAADVLADALAVEVDEVEESVALALKAGVLRSTPGATPRFAHDLLRETLYVALAPSRRVALHRRIAVALEQRADQGGSVTAAEVAHHYACSAPAGNADGVLQWAMGRRKPTVRASPSPKRPVTSPALGWHWRRPVSSSPSRHGSICWSPRPKHWPGRASPGAPESCWCVREATPKPARIPPGSGPSPSGCSAWGLGLRCGAMT